MTHGHRLRQKAKGRQGHQSTDDTDGQVEGTSASTSNTSEGGHITLTDELEGDIVDRCPATPDTPEAVHMSPAPIQGSRRETIEEDRQRHQRSIVTAAIISAPTAASYRVRGTPTLKETRLCEEARRIRREQIIRGYEEELHALRSRIVALRREREAEVKKVRRKRERAWAIKRGEVAVVVEDGEEGLVGSGSVPEEAHGGDESKRHYLPVETPFNDGYQGWQCPSRSAPGWSRPKSNFPPPSLGNSTQQQHLLQQEQPHLGTFQFGLDAMWEDVRGPRGTNAGRRLLRNHLGVGQDQGRPQPQPLRRRQAQLLAINGDNDSEMGEPL